MVSDNSQDKKNNFTFMYGYTDRTHLVLAVLRSGSLGEIRHVSATFRFLLANLASSLKYSGDI
jgi:hypothetical protein